MTDSSWNRKMDQSETRFQPVAMKMVPSNIIEKIVGASQNEDSETIQPISVDYSLEFQKLQEAEKLKSEKNAQPEPPQKTQKRKPSFNPRIAKSKSASSYLDKFVKVSHSF